MNQPVISHGAPGNDLYFFTVHRDCRCDNFGYFFISDWIGVWYALATQTFASLITAMTFQAVSRALSDWACLSGWNPLLLLNSVTTPY
jgi:hypothetical protein